MNRKWANKRAKIWNFQTNQKRMRVFEPRMGRIRAKKEEKKIEFRFLEPKMGQEWAKNTNFSNQNVLFPRG